MAASRVHAQRRTRRGFTPTAVFAPTSTVTIEPEIFNPTLNPDLLAIELGCHPARIKFCQSHRHWNAVDGLRFPLFEPEVDTDQPIQFELLFPTGFSVSAESRSPLISRSGLAVSTTAAGEG
jgi:hypothetical protein